MEKQANLKGRFCAMLDCSRNGVLNESAVYRYIDLLSKMGYNGLMLYTEDTYQVENEPYFGYLRGRYSFEEIKRIDAYAKEKCMELIPCIQTLAHLNAIFRWPDYNGIRDVNDILLLEEERTYTLIENMFQTIKNTFSTNLVAIGMDEAHMLGRGRYADKHGIRNKFDLMNEHLNKVSEIAKKYGFNTIMWSDMFLRIANDGNYYGENPIPNEIAEKIPENVKLIYWDYYHADKNSYRRIIKAHGLAQNDLWFAGGADVWGGFTPRIEFSLKAMKSALSVCKEKGINNIIITLWGDDGRECSTFNALSMLYYAIEIYKGNDNLTNIKSGFNRLIGEHFDDFKLLESPNKINGNRGNTKNPSKYMFYNDPFSGIFDSAVIGGEGEQYRKMKSKLFKAMKRSPNFAYLFEFQYNLCNVLQTKYELGFKTRKAYKSGDKEQLKEVIKDYAKTVNALRKFLNCFEKLWTYENKPTGLEIHQIRVGGLIQRILSCKKVLENYVNGKIDRIEELEQEIKDVYNLKENGNATLFNSWLLTVSPNVV